jgi:uncharacterized delta-60 repeat protein
MGINVNTKRNAMWGKLTKQLASLVVSLFLAPIVAFAAPGDLDSSFGSSGKVITPIGTAEANAQSIAVQLDGKIVLGGNCFDGGHQSFCLARYLSNGLIDLSFGTDGAVIVPSGGKHNYSRKVSIDGAGRILLAGSCDSTVPPNFQTRFCVARFLSDGTIDATFSNGGVAEAIAGITNSFAEAIAVQQDGSVLVAGTCHPTLTSGQLPCVVRFTSNGQTDSTFGANGLVAIFLPETHSGAARSVVLQRDGKILVGGWCGAMIADFCVTRLDHSGQVDSAFGLNGIAVVRVGGDDSFGESLALYEDGRIVLAGTCYNGQTSLCFARFLANGTLDQSLASVGWKVTVVGPGSIEARGAAIQQDGRLVIGGNCHFDVSDDLCVFRFLTTGALDPDFNSVGWNSTAVGSRQDLGFEVTLQNDGEILLAGSCEKLFDPPTVAYRRFCMARFGGGPYPGQACGLNVDANLVTSPLTDARLVIGYLFGFRGDALTAGALGANPGRTSQQITDHLAQLKTEGKLDVDGDGEVNAMTDGLLILRAMLGLSGDALVAGARNASHPNVRDAKQILTWVEATHGVACLP